MKLSEDTISKLPLLDEKEFGGLYADGEFETAVLADFNKEADKIDSQYSKKN